MRERLQQLGIAASLTIMSALFALSSRAHLKPPLPRFTHSDKVAHVIAYGALGACLGFALGARWSSGWRRRALIAAMLATLYGITDELHQSFVPGRDASLGDLLADALGAALGAGFAASAATWLSPHMSSEDLKTKA